MEDEIIKEFRRLRDAVDAADEAGEDVGPALDAVTAFAANHGLGEGGSDPDQE